MTFADVEHILKDTTHSTYPVVVSREQPYVVGQVLRRDLQIVLSTSKPTVTSLRRRHVSFTLQDRKKCNDID